MKCIHFCGLVLLLLATAAVYPANAQRCVMGLDAYGNPNGPCDTGGDSSYDSRDYSDPSNGKNTNFFQALVQFPLRVFVAGAAAPICALQAVGGDAGCFKRSIEGVANTFPPAKLIPAGTSIFGQQANPSNVQVSPWTPTTATNPTSSAQAVSTARDSRTAALTPSDQNARASAGYGFNTNPSTSSTPLYFGAVGTQLTAPLRSINAYFSNHARYLADLQNHEAALKAAANNRRSSAAQLRALHAQVDADRSNITRNQNDLYQYVRQPAVAQQIPPAVQQQVSNVIRYRLDR